MGQGADDLTQRWAATGSEHGTTTPAGRAHIKTRLLSCPSLDALRRVWDGIAPAYQRNPEVMKLKDDMKKALSK
jgi:hypothetical protein